MTKTTSEILPETVEWAPHQAAYGDEPRAKKPGVLAALGFGAAAFGVAALGALAMQGRGSAKSRWFRSLKKPSFQPPDSVFGPVWTVLYATIAYSGYRIWRAPKSKRRTAALGLWATQLALNGAWTPLFFRKRDPKSALLDIGILDAATAAYAAVGATVDGPAAAAVAPYLGWLGFATALNAKIAADNP